MNLILTNAFMSERLKQDHGKAWWLHLRWIKPNVIHASQSKHLSFQFPDLKFPLLDMIIREYWHPQLSISTVVELFSLSVFCLPVKLCPAAAVVSATWLNPVFLECPWGVKTHDTQWAKEIMKCQVDCSWVVVTHNIHDPRSKTGLAFYALVHMNSL